MNSTPSSITTAVCTNKVEINRIKILKALFQEVIIRKELISGSNSTEV
jgi:predicted nucleic acid-binding protein